MTNKFLLVLCLIGAAAQASQIQTKFIADQAVTYAKIQNVAANSFLARSASSSGVVSAVALAASQLAGRGATGDVAAITLGTGLSMSGTTLNASSSGGNLNAKFHLDGAVVLFTDIGGPHYQVGTQSLTAVNISMLNSGTANSTTIRVNQYRSGSLQNSATASLTASSGNPAGSSANLSGTLSLLAGDIITVDVTAVASGTPESLTVEY